MSFWSRLVPLLGAIVVAAGLVAFALTYSRASRELARIEGGFPYYQHLVLALPFIPTAALLILGGRRDRRALALGTFCLLVAVPQFNRPLRMAFEYGYPGADFFRLINSIEVDCFIPFFLWLFVRDFPAAPLEVEARRWLDGMVKASGWVGVALFSVNLLPALLQTVLPGVSVPLLDQVGPQRSKGLYYMIVLPLTAAAFVTLWWRSRSHQGSEDWRGRLLIPTLLCGFGLLLLDTLLALFVTPYREYIQSHSALNRTLTFAVTLPTLIVPPFIARAVFIHHALDVRLIARRALQYALARYSVLILATAPLIAMIFYLRANRDERLGDFFTGSRLLLLLSVFFLGLAALRYRKTLLDSIDRRFFREQYDARQILTLLVDRIRSVRDIADLAKLVCQEIDLALHLESVTFLVVEPRSGLLVDPQQRSRRLDASSKLALLVAGASDPLDVTLEGTHTPFSRLPDPEKHWLVDNGMRLIVPILARDGTLLGMIGLGEKKSGLPYLREDRQLLHAIANNSAWVLELAQTQSTPPPHAKPRPFPKIDTSEPPPAVEVAKECPACGTVFQPFTILCTHDSRRLEASHVPYILPGKFRFERRIGIGGMGVVYQASDLGLGRPVAVKTLRRVSPEDAMRLRREARTAAAVSHPHLAAVHGMETWQGTPMLVMELLEGGTLAKRFEKGKLSPGETVELGIAMASSLAKLHAADILHRDVKPSNIGFTRDGVPKLMDFGIARLMFDLSREGDLGDGASLDDSSLLPPTSIWNNPGTLTASQQLVGTLSYLSPEALDHRAPDVSFDLWGLAIVLYECLLGRKVFTGSDVRQLMNRIRSGRVPDFAQVLPELDPLFGDLFRAALHPSVTRRPASAADMRRRLVEIQAQLG